MIGAPGQSLPQVGDRQLLGSQEAGSDEESGGLTVVWPRGI